ncbi:MAG: transcriptional regulator NrdR [Planctomycetota bacterium]
MRCPYCQSDQDRVLDTRTTKGGFLIRRKRLCLECERRFSTVEKIEQQNLRVVKRDETREPFNREKIRRGIERACSKRPVTTLRIDEVVQDIESYVYNEFEGEIPAKKLGEIVMEQLVLLDEVAYIRFASVYQEFHSAEDFLREVSRLTTDAGKSALSRTSS